LHAVAYFILFYFHNQLLIIHTIDLVVLRILLFGVLDELGGTFHTVEAGEKMVNSAWALSLASVNHLAGTQEQRSDVGL
jgi:hypothetical protein